MSSEAPAPSGEEPATPKRKPKPKAVRVFVIGGGCAGLSAAWHLARQPGFEIHVIEQNPYLGGKGASFRRAQDGRILEHGLHLWLGFYENAFRMMRDCYAEVEQRGWGPQASGVDDRLPHASFGEAFFPEPQVGVGGRNAADEWRLWTSVLPPADGLPGDPLDARTNPFTLQSYLGRCLTLVRALLLSVVGPADDDGTSDLRAGRRASPRALIDQLTDRLRQGALVGAGVLLQAISIFEDWLRSVDFGAGAADSAVEAIEAIASQVRRQLRDFVSLDEALRWKTEVIDIVMTIAVGLYRDRVLLGSKGLDALNDIDYRTWLLRHGATPGAVDSAFMRGIYDLLFAYRDGDRGKPALAAGVALRGALRMFFTYRGSMFWKMRSGMGETVFSPLYKVLGSEPPKDMQDAWPSRPVHFHLGARLEHVELEADGPGATVRASRLEFAVDAPSGSPLDHLGCWPEPPAAGRSQQPARHVLVADRDFHAVVFAAGVDALRTVTGDRLKKLVPRWDEMVHQVKTVATSAAQVWLPHGMADLGWVRGPAVVSALDPPFETWADMSHVLEGEQAWRVRHGVAAPQVEAQAVAYLCGVVADASLSDEQQALRDWAGRLLDLLADDRARPVAAARGSLDDRLAALLEDEPQAVLKLLLRLAGEVVNAPELRRALSDLGGGEGDAAAAALARRLLRRLRTDPSLATLLKETPDRTPRAGAGTWLHAFWPRAGDAQWRQGMQEAFGPGAFVRLNARGHERYTTSLPRTIRYRISPLDGSVSNLALAGDWTACGLDAGCVEAAVMSGMLAAHAISGGTPSLNQIVGFDHP